MNTQPEALLALADRIEEAQGKPIAIDPQAAAELRCLYEVNQELLEALGLADAMLRGAHMNANVVHKKISTAIAKATGEQQ